MDAPVLQQLRAKFCPALPSALQEIEKLQIKKEAASPQNADSDRLCDLFPHTFNQPHVIFEKKGKQEHSALKIGVVFSGGQASGGHNVISGLFDALKKLNKGSKLFGFLGGPSGIIEKKSVEITKEILEPYRNQGGFDLIGSGRTKIETREQLFASKASVEALSLDGIVVVGGDDSNTNAAILAEYFLKEGCKTKVVGVPKTIDGDLRSEHIEISFGFDTACKVYAELIGNIERDALSAKKYYHFIKLMGRSASHIALECAMQTHPNICLISEEAAEMKWTLKDITSSIADIVIKRSEMGKNYGVVLIPEGLIEFVPEMKLLITELNALLARQEGSVTTQEISLLLSAPAAACFALLPGEIQQQLLLDRDPHGNVQVSRIETEKLLIKTVEAEVKKRAQKIKFKAIAHFMGYEGRSGMPSNFDANYCYSLGYVAALLLNGGCTGYMSCLGNLKASAEEWQVKGIPICSLMNFETRKGVQKPVIKKALVELEGAHFKAFAKNKEEWAFEDRYRFPGAIQYFGPKEVTDEPPMTL